MRQTKKRIGFYLIITLFKHQKTHAKMKIYIYSVLYNAMQCTHLNILLCIPNPLGQLRPLFIQLNNTSCDIL